MPKVEMGMMGLMAVETKAAVVVNEVLNTACIARLYESAMRRCRQLSKDSSARRGMSNAD